MSRLTAELERLRDCVAQAAAPADFRAPLGAGDFRVEAHDFRVTEHGFVPCGSGEHLAVRVRKTGQNTRWVAKRLAESLSVPYRMVSYAGLKDRHAVTEQWFTVHVPGRPADEVAAAAAGLCIEGAEVRATGWHNRKLRPGQLSYNEFDIQLRNCTPLDQARLAARINEIERQGVPNFFGAQRFGRDLSNLSFATQDADTPADFAALVRSMGREQRSFVISALRGALFNGYLQQRVSAGTWAQAAEQDTVLSDRDRGIAEDDTSVFVPARLPSGLLWGKRAGARLAQDEQAWFDGFPAVTALLEAAGSRASRRVLVCRVAQLQTELADKTLRLRFKLGPGAYATTVIENIVNLRNVA